MVTLFFLALQSMGVKNTRAKELALECFENSESIYAKHLALFFLIESD